MKWTVKTWEMIASLLLIVGGINWGLVGVFGYNLLETILGSYPTLLQVVYGLVGISGVFTLVNMVREMMD